MLSKEEVNKQSELTYQRWYDIWHDNAKHNAKYKQKLNLQIFGSGKNKSCIICSYGTSLIKNLEKIKKHQLHLSHDIICIDKALGTLLKYEIIPNAVICSDARVQLSDCIDMSKFNKNLVKKIKLIISISGSITFTDFWAENKGEIIFCVYKDGIRTQSDFEQYINFRNPRQPVEALYIPAATNVGNSAVVIASLVYNYNDIKLFGYDYSFPYGSYFYADRDGEDRDTKIKKSVCNNHGMIVDIAGNIVCSSQNMIFSAKWLVGFSGEMIKKNINIINCTGAGILSTPTLTKLKD